MLLDASGKFSSTPSTGEHSSRAIIRSPRAKPLLGYLGNGWLGRHRLQAIQRSEVASLAAVAEAGPELARLVRQMPARVEQLSSLDELLESGIDGLILAVPAPEQATLVKRALEAGIPVFSQRPLGRTRQEMEEVLATARRADLLLALDLPYRHIKGISRLRQLLRDGSLGHIHAVNMTFHQGHRPDKSWQRDPVQSGGGCLMDLGAHLLDLTLWLLDYPTLEQVSSHFFVDGTPLADPATAVEDYALVQGSFAGAGAMQLACSWSASTGTQALIELTLHGSKGGAALRNRNGSPYSFVVEQFQGTSRQILDQVFEDWQWGDRAALSWAQKVASGAHFDPAASGFAAVAGVVDQIYGRS